MAVTPHGYPAVKPVILCKALKQDIRRRDRCFRTWLHKVLPEVTGTGVERMHRLSVLVS